MAKDNSIKDPKEQNVQPQKVEEKTEEVSVLPVQDDTTSAQVNDKSTTSVHDEKTDEDIQEESKKDSPKEDTTDGVNSQEPKEEIKEEAEVELEEKNADDKADEEDNEDEDEDEDDEENEEDEDKEYDPTDEHKLEEKGTGKKKISGHIIISKTDNPNAKWYVVHTASGHEVRVAETLRQRVETQSLHNTIFELLVPTQDRVIIRSGKKQNIKEKIFPGYLLVKLILDDPTWLAVRTTPGITGFVGTGKTPTPLSDAEVANIQKFVSTPAKRFKTKFSKGEAVKITDGPFSGFLGSVDDIDEEKGKVKVLVSIFGRETPVELDLLQITKV